MDPSPHQILSANGNGQNRTVKSLPDSIILQKHKENEDEEEVLIVINHSIIISFRIIYKAKGYNASLQGISGYLVTSIFGYLTPKEKMKYAMISKDLSKSSLHPCLWRDISIFNKQQIELKKFRTLVHRNS